MLSACGKKDEQQTNTPPPGAPAASAPAPATPAPTSTTLPTPAPSTTPAPTGTTPAPATTSGKSASLKPADNIKVTSVTIGSAVDASLAISREQRSFKPQDKDIYASVATTGNTDNATLNAKWSYVEGKEQPFSTTSESIATTGPAVTTFKVENPNAWPQGRYKVEISLNGRTVASEDFIVRG
ncbi:hypothetical protein CA260_01195 [Dyella jiangningensis]|uniref:Uncharacterized protein n=2 Tax=Dyella jiangningensis TaxID=1379159 RepID=A0A328P716_9GAMM|nr:hypothetical protein CA260_01195 [Dyella jiangningensis]